MNNTQLAFLLTTLAGFSTLLGTILIFFKFKNKNKIIANSLSFAAGVMITVSVLDLVPESIKLLRPTSTPFWTITLSFLFIIIGIVISSLIDYYLPSNSYNNDNLYKVGIISMLAIIIHNIPEGIATFIATNSNVFLGFSLALAIALHNIPEGISISVPIYYATSNKKKALLYTLVSALSEPIGAVLAYLFLSKFINNTILGLLFSLIAGIMLQISFCELLPGSKKYNINTTFFFILGVLIMIFNLILNYLII